MTESSNGCVLVDETYPQKKRRCAVWKLLFHFQILHTSMSGCLMNMSLLKRNAFYVFSFHFYVRRLFLYLKEGRVPPGTFKPISEKRIWVSYGKSFLCIERGNIGRDTLMGVDHTTILEVCL
jgi:hypothetical protein